MKPKDFIKMCEDAIEKVCLQRYPSVSSDGRCLYKSERGCCVVGHMMPDDETRMEADKLEDSGVKVVIYEGIWGHNMFTPQQEETLLSLQLIHDSFQNESVIDIVDFDERCSAVLETYKDTLQ